MARTTLGLLLVSLLLPACGGADGERATRGELANGGAPAVDPCAADAGYEFLVVEDFDDGRAQNWWSSSDKTPGSTMEPDPARQGPSTTELEAPRCGSTHALRVKATGLAIYGAAFGTSTLAQPDVSDYDGLSLWVKRNPGAPGVSLFVALNDGQTDASSGGECDDLALYEHEKCDRFGAGVSLEEEWRFVTIPFDYMRQRGFGVIVPELDTSAITGLNMSFEVGDWDFFIDDVAFYRAP